jgi:Fe-S-cluster-containing dehydrogenase component
MMRAMTDKIQTIPEICSGCRICQLACSSAWARSYNPAQARILIDDTEATKPVSITFTDECNDCGICVKYCFYGALKLREAEGKL